MECASLSGKVCVVTGATSGIGLATAKALASLGAATVLVGRDGTRLQAAVEEVARAGDSAGAVPPQAEIADFSSMAQVASLARRIGEANRQVYGLVNCAGVYTTKRRLGPEGLETQFAVNHLAPFLLTIRLLPMIAPEGRIATVSSGSHFFGWIRWKDPSLKGRYFGLWAYEQSKLANVLFSYELARRLEQSSLRTSGTRREGHIPTVFAVDPGLVDTSMGEKDGKSLESLFWSLRRRKGTSPDRPAQAISRLLSSPATAGKTGHYWLDAVPITSSRRSYDETAAARLWALSESLIALALERAQ